MSSDERTSKPVEILLVEDNEGDIILTKKAFEKARILNNISIAKDGEIAMQMLRKEGEYTETPTPDIVFLDINLPKKDGTQVLAEIKSDQKLSSIPVVMLTGSEAQTDILSTYELRASSYVVKPITLEKFGVVMRTLDNLWFNVVITPEED